MKGLAVAALVIALVWAALGWIGKKLSERQDD